jgi:hypothetical protein
MTLKQKMLMQIDMMIDYLQDDIQDSINHAVKESDTSMLRSDMHNDLRRLHDYIAFKNAIDQNKTDPILRAEVIEMIMANEEGDGEYNG